MQDYIEANGILVNPLVQEGYPSIGCAPCTAKPAEGADPRHRQVQRLVRQPGAGQAAAIPGDAGAAVLHHFRLPFLPHGAGGEVVQVFGQQRQAVRDMAEQVRFHQRPRDRAGLVVVQPCGLAERRGEGDEARRVVAGRIQHGGAVPTGSRRVTAGPPCRRYRRQKPNSAWGLSTRIFRRAASSAQSPSRLNSCTEPTRWAKDRCG